jgi:hypothetical protein
MTRKKRRGQAYVEPIVHWIVYRPGKDAKKHSYATVYLESYSEASSVWGIDKGRAIRFRSLDDAQRALGDATINWEDHALAESFLIVPSDTVTV